MISRSLLFLVSDFAWEFNNQSTTSLNIRENGVGGSVLTYCFVEDISGLIFFFPSRDGFVIMVEVGAQQ